jgi:hypothetical protein
VLDGMQLIVVDWTQWTNTKQKCNQHGYCTCAVESGYKTISIIPRISDQEYNQYDSCIPKVSIVIGIDDMWKCRIAVMSQMNDSI